MPTEKKIEKVNKIQDSLSRCTVAIATNYIGLNANDMTEFRQRLREQNIEYRVVKNTLATIAADRVGRENFKRLLQGPAGIAFGYGDPTLPAKVLVEYIRSTKSVMRITGGLVGNRFLNAEEVNTLATLPSKEVLLARLTGQMRLPINQLVFVLSANLRGLLAVLQGRLKQLESTPPVTTERQATQAI
jgi:large subunit ribosomal protein L10